MSEIDTINKAWKRTEGEWEKTPYGAVRMVDGAWEAKTLTGKIQNRFFKREHAERWVLAYHYARKGNLRVDTVIARIRRGEPTWRLDRPLSNYDAKRKTRLLGEDVAHWTSRFDVSERTLVAAVNSLRLDGLTDEDIIEEFRLRYEGPNTIKEALAVLKKAVDPLRRQKQMKLVRAIEFVLENDTEL